MAGSLPRGWTIVGLIIAMFAIPVITTAHQLLAPDPASSGSIVARELAILALTALLLWIVVTRERLPLSSIGIRFDRPGRSLAWGLALAIACIAAAVACLAIYGAIGVRYGEGTAISRSLPVASLVVLRAGIAEEIFYRGYLIERLQSWTGSAWLAAGVSLVFFAAFHFRQGLAGVVLSFVIGAVLTAFYLWKRDLTANIFAHFLIDFVPNVLLVALGLVD